MDKNMMIGLNTSVTGNLPENNDDISEKNETNETMEDANVDDLEDEADSVDVSARPMLRGLVRQINIKQKRKKFAGLLAKRFADKAGLLCFFDYYG